MRKGRGKSGGVKVIFYFRLQAVQILMLTFYPKNVADSLPSHILKQIKKRLKMNKRTQRRDIGTEILEGIRQMKKGEIGRVIVLPAISEIRNKVGLSQSEFANLLGVSVRTLQEWEQGRRTPSGPARTLLAIAHQNPKALLDVAF